ncbi:hypothetical protein V8G54_022716 [Vigna mungo]|uniref:Uncharacterized protein n=1 Tax=Vigna mungo TaxID=3915 RepID=A0AAQ3N3K5_VIGMU
MIVLSESEFLNKPTHDVEECEATVELRESIYNQELLLEFLLLIQKKKVEAAEKLQHSITFLCSDIAEVTKQKTEFMEISGTALASDDCSTSRFFPSTVVVDNDENSTSPRTRKRVRTDTCVDDTAECDDQKNEESRLSKSPQFLKNFKKLEHAYFSTRSKSSYSSGKVHVVEHTPVSANGRGSFVVTERSCVSKVASKEQFREGKIPWANPFLEGLQKYLSFSRLKVKADLKQGDLLHSFNLVCSVSFDRDAEFFATAGVNKKIKVFEYDSTINEDLDIQYPVVEMVSRSTLSSTCWNTYVKSQIASSNFEGVVQLWDVTTSQVQCEMREHNQRAWSIDFSSADPTLLASASDDGSVKLWTINQGVSVGTIKTKANVCCVQFHLDFAHFLAFGSADHQIYYYDLRNMKEPLCTLVGHNRTVSYIKFVDSVSLVSASTDNTLKLWDLSNSASRVIDSPLQSFTGHKNIKVFIYHKAFPMPALSFKFYSSDPLPVDEANDPSNFITSVCWRGQSTTLIAANSTGNVKILQMV